MTTVTIGDFEYEIRPLPAGAALKVLQRLGRMLAPALKDGGGTAAIGTFFEGLQDGDLEYLVSSVLGDYVVRIDSGKRIPLKKETVDLLFMGKLGDLMRLVMEALKVNFADFFTAAAGAMGGAQPPKAP